MTVALPAWLVQRTARERLVLLLAALLALGLSVQTLIWQPLQARRIALEDRLFRLDLAMEVLARAPVPAAFAARDDRPLNVVLTETAATFNLTIRRLEPDGDRMRLVMDEAAFDAVILWIAQLEREHAVTLVGAEMARRPEPGVVSVNLVVER